MATVLVVDDEEPVREFLAMVLTDAGHRAILAIHGAQALEMAQGDQPDLVITDAMMPVLGGGELCRRLKSEPTTKAIPVILMSAAGDRMADGTGCDAFIAKPFNLSEMEALVTRFLPAT